MSLRPDDPKCKSDLPIGGKTRVHLLHAIEANNHSPQNAGDHCAETEKPYGHSKEHHAILDRGGLAAISSHRENFVAYKVQSDCLRFGAVKKVAFDSVFDHCPKLLPSVALCDDALRQAHRGITALGFYLDFKYKLAYVGSAHPMSFGKGYHAT